jgi:hypothetical protein
MRRVVLVLLLSWPGTVGYGAADDTKDKKIDLYFPPVSVGPTTKADRIKKATVEVIIQDAAKGIGSKDGRDKIENVKKTDGEEAPKAGPIYWYLVKVKWSYARDFDEDKLLGTPEKLEKGTKLTGTYVGEFTSDSTGSKNAKGYFFRGTVQVGK